MEIQIEILLLALSILFFVSIVIGKLSSKVGVPALLLFLLVGMISGTDGLGISFDNAGTAQIVGTISLCIILFSGGMNTRISEIKPIIKEGVSLATIGVLLTSIITGFLIYMIFGFTISSAKIGLTTSLLLAATMSSTDSASVFSILRSKGLHLKNNLRPVLELESGSNDPMAYVLVVTLIEICKLGEEPNYLTALIFLLLQLLIGAAAGYLIAKGSIHLINRLKIDNSSLYPILSLTLCIFIFSFTYFIKGNGYLAVYIGGLVFGNNSFVHKRSSVNFFDGIAWLCQLLMFLTLGLLVNPHELIPIAGSGLIISLIMIFISRPLSVFISLLPFNNMGIKDKIYISWCGLRGAVPIIFAIMPLAADVPHAHLIFNIVFFCTLLSLLLQGTTIPIMAKWLGLEETNIEKHQLENFDVDFSDEIKSVTTEITMTEEILQRGNQLMNLSLPDKTLVVMIKRDNKYFVPTGKTTLHDQDKLMIITDDHEALMETYKQLGIRKGKK